jgi:hypothetical protein
MSEEWPTVWVLFATFKRTVAALRTIEMLKQHLHYPNLHIHVCDDGSGKTDDGTDRWHVGVLTEAIAEFDPTVTYHEMDTPPGRFNTGGNVNRGIRAAQENGCDIYLLDFDDWALRRDLDLCPMVDVLDTYEEVGFIRLSYWVPWLYSVTARYDSPRLQKNYMWQRLLRVLKVQNRPGDWPADHYLVSTQPYVAHTRFHDAYGWHPENVNPGMAETGLGDQYNNSPLGEDGPQILFPIGEITVHGYYDHLVGRAHHYAKV